MIDKKELIEKIDKEMGLWQSHYNQIELHLYPMIAACFRAQASYTLNEENKVDPQQIFNMINKSLLTIDDDSECLNNIYCLIVNCIGDSYVKEIEKAGDGKELSVITPDQALNDIENELIARENINKESLIALRTLTWVKSLLDIEKEN